MPIFEYECIECGEHVEHLQLSSDAPLSKCPHCGGSVRKLMSAPAFQFKGTGWYVTDYAGKGKSGGDDKGDSSSSSSKDGAVKSSAKSKDSSAGTSESSKSAPSSSSGNSKAKASD